MLCVWNGDGLVQSNTAAHPASIIIDIDFCGHSSSIVSLGSDKRLCIWTYKSLQLVHEIVDVTSTCFAIHRTNFLFYSQLNSLFIADTANPSKVSSRQFRIPFLNDTQRDDTEMTVDKLVYASASETVIAQNGDVVYAMHLPQQLFLVR